MKRQQDKFRVKCVAVLQRGFNALICKLGFFCAVAVRELVMPKGAICQTALAA